MTTICCVCKKTKNKDSWQTQVLKKSTPVSHGYCPVCYEDFMNKMALYITK